MTIKKYPDASRGTSMESQAWIQVRIRFTNPRGWPREGNKAFARAEERRSRLAEIDSELAEAEALIRRMDLEARSTQGSARQELQQRLKERKDDLQRLKKAAKDASKGPQAAQTDRQALLSSGPLSDEEAPTSSSQRENMLSATERIRKTGDKIQHGKKQLLESEELGANILQDLHRQRETITHARDTLYSTDETIGRSRKILSAMARRAVQNKLILGVVGVILLVAIILVIYFKS